MKNILVFLTLLVAVPAQGMVNKIKKTKIFSLIAQQKRCCNKQALVFDVDIDKTLIVSQSELKYLINKNPDRTSRLLYLIETLGFSKTVTCYAALSSNINERAPMTGETALTLAARLGNKRLIAYLLGLSGIDINAPNGDGRTPLMAAAYHGKDDVVMQLLERRNVDIKARDTQGNSIMYYLFHYCRDKVTPEMIELLVERGAPKHLIEYLKHGSTRV